MAAAARAVIGLGLILEAVGAGSRGWPFAGECGPWM